MVSRTRQPAIPCVCQLCAEVRLRHTKMIKRDTNERIEFTTSARFKWSFVKIPLREHPMSSGGANLHAQANQLQLFKIYKSFGRFD